MLIGAFVPISRDVMMYLLGTVLGAVRVCFSCSGFPILGRKRKIHSVGSVLVLV